MIQQEKFRYKILDSSPVWGLTSTRTWGHIAPMFNRWIRPYLQFNRQERWGAVLLIMALFGLYAIASLFPKSKGFPAPPAQAEQDSPRGGIGQNTGLSPNRTGHRLAPFDPNRLNEADWVDLGIPPRTARTIRKYLDKGGRFKQPEDLGKIWGLKPSDLDRLLPYVQIHSENNDRGYMPHADRNNDLRSVPKVPNWVSIDINRSDSAAWESLPGIGPVFARRIVRYRDRLGGFVHAEQIAETYQLPDSVFERIRPFLKSVDTNPVRTLSLNTISIDSLGRHPYCNFSMARILIRYREQHGPFRSLEDLLDIQRVDSAWWLRIRPYLRLE